jgi:DNA-binding NarL/FixJ family response regulator
VGVGVNGLSSRITPAEFRVLVLLVLDARTPEQTAHILGISHQTVKVHWLRICEKQNIPPDRDYRIWVLRQLLGLEVAADDPVNFQ